MAVNKQMDHETQKRTFQRVDQVHSKMQRTASSYPYYQNLRQKPKKIRPVLKKEIRPVLMYFHRKGSN